VNAKANLWSGQNPISWIAAGRRPAIALDHPAAKNAILDLGGPDAISPLDVVKLFEQAGGRPFELQFVPEEALQAQQAAATDPMQETFSVLMRFVASGNPIDMSATLQTFAVQPTKVEEYVRQVLAPA
jgi:uncharacterized protein YbjT (DUF2867 family)